MWVLVIISVLLNEVTIAAPGFSVIQEKLSFCHCRGEGKINSHTRSGLAAPADEEGRKSECGEGWEELVPASPPIAASARSQRRKLSLGIGKAGSSLVTTT